MVSTLNHQTPTISQSKLTNQGWIIFKECSAKAGFWLTLLTSLIVVINQYESVSSLDPFYRVTMPSLCLAFSFLVTFVNIRAGIICCLFALPLLPNLTWQIQIHFGYGRIASLHNAGIDLMAGLFLGAILNQIINRKKLSLPREFPWQAGLAMAFISASVALAISRNLHQTQSFFQWSSFFYNLTHLRSIGWHDDFRPLFDWITYGCAFALVAVLTTNLSLTPKSNDIVFIPIILSLIISAIVGFKQSKYGMGLSLDQINFRVDQFGYMALGFQHDIHAFAGQMLIGSIGLFGYLYYTKQPSMKLLIIAAIPLCWIALFLSKSKSNFALSVFFLIVISAIWIFRHARLTRPLLKAILMTVVLVSISAVFFQQLWISALTQFAQFLGLADIEALNIKLSYRPEVYLAALKLFSLDPILGLGQSEFYRQAASYSLTNSHFLSIDQNGENAHNYFLQTLAETGLVGVCIFSLLIFYPVWCLKDKRILIPAGVGLGAIFVGNIFAHSMLVRENLFIAAGFIGLMYAWAAVSDKKAYRTSISKHPFLLTILICITSVLTVHEVYLSYRSIPFTEDIQCFKARPLDRDGWTSGLYKVAIPEGARGMTLELKGVQPGVASRPLAATLSIRHGARSVIQTNEILFKEDGPRKLRIDFPQNAVADDGEYRVELRLQRCFIPRNMGINSDGRRLGIQIQSSTANFE